ERSRPATATETAELGPLAQGFRVVGLAAPGTVREATTQGSVDTLLLTGRRGSRPTPVARTVTQVEPSALTPRPDVAALASAALQDIPPFRAPEWDTVARRLAASGCPFMALALADAGLTSTAAGRVVRTAALATIREAVKRPPRRADDDAADGPTRGEAPEAPETSPPDPRVRVNAAGAGRAVRVLAHYAEDAVAPCTAGWPWSPMGIPSRPARTMATATYRVFDPLLPRAQAERMLRLCERFGAYGMYS